MPKVRFRLEQNQNRAKRRPAERSKDLSPEKVKRRRAKPRETPSVQKSEWPKLIYFRLLKMSEQNKLIKMVTDSAVLVGLTAGVGYLAKKILNEHFLGDPSSNVMNYAKFTGVLAGSMALKTYLEDQKILPKSI